MGYQGVIGRTVDVTAVARNQFLYFGPFARGDVIRGIVLQLWDEGGNIDFPVKLGVAVFGGTKQPAATLSTFGAGRQLIAGDVQNDIPITHVPVSPDDSPMLSVPIHYRANGDEWIGVFLYNGATADRMGGCYIDTDTGAEARS